MIRDLFQRQSAGNHQPEAFQATVASFDEHGSSSTFLPCVLKDNEMCV